MLYLPQAYEPYRAQFENSRLEYVKITTTPTSNDALSLTQSKFGGYPYMPQGFDYPRNAKGNMMPLLAQINFAEVPPLAGFPESGLLQFYATADDMMGMHEEFDSGFPVTQKNYRVVYHPSFTNEEGSRIFVDIPTTAASEFDFVPGSYALQFEKTVGYVPLTGVDCQQVLGEYHFENLQEEIDDYEENDRLRMEYYAKNGEEFIQHKIGGYANPVQEDLRRGTRKKPSPIAHYQQLLQIASDRHIRWADMGVAHFFIDPADLQVLDFSRVIYYWSCG